MDALMATDDCDEMIMEMSSFNDFLELKERKKLQGATWARSDE